MPEMTNNKKDDLLPARPGEKPVNKEIKGTPYTIYINGKPIQMSKREAIGLMSQVLNLICYFDELENAE